MDLDLFIVRLYTKDSCGFFGFVKIGQICSKSVSNSNPQTESFEKLRICDPQYKPNPDSFCKAQIEPIKVRICDPQNDMNPWFAIQIHGYTIP
jgi:hypothetical protein